MFPDVVRAVINGITSMSWEEGINAMVANVGDLVISVSGIELAAKGEENLWA
ncbi:MAG: hypothetical protein AAF849_15970 [Bacteroidota bacterium]